MAKFTKDDFKIPLGFIPQELIDCMNKVDEETDELAKKAYFCRGHHFDREADYLLQRVQDRSSVLVSICNSLGKYF